MVGIVVAAGCLLLVVMAVGWHATGGRWAVIRTPSMGTAAPVGTLILSRPAQLGDLGVGDIVTYHPRNEPTVLITHRVVGVSTDGLQVRGDINGSPDPFAVRQSDLVGQVVVRVPALGWLVRIAPFLLLGGLMLTVITRRYLPAPWRFPVRVLGWCVLVSATLLLVRPLVRPVVMGLTTDGSTTMASVVSAGLLPTRIVGAAGHQITLGLGETGVVVATPLRPGGPALVNGSPDLHGWWLLAVIIVCLLPTVVSVLVGLVRPTARRAA